MYFHCGRKFIARPRNVIAMWISCVVLFLAAGCYALWPLFAKTFYESAAPTAETDAEYLVARKTAIYRNIKELEFEYKTGRLPETDFRRLTSEYKGEAVEILKKLDMLNVSGVKPESDGKAGICPACGAKTIPCKKFCADCGARLQAASENPEIKACL